VGHEVAKISAEPELVKLSQGLLFYFLDLLEKGAKSQKSENDVFTDLVTYFKSKNYSEDDGRKLAMYFLGVYGTRGASFLSGFNDLHPASLSAMVTLSLAISYLDKLALKEGKSYAIPQQYKTGCSIGKPYHFWLSAFLNTYIKAQGYSSISGYFVPILTGITYDMVMTANGRDIAQLFTIKTPYDFYANMTRIDNFARALGSHFGKYNGNPPEIKADELLMDFFEKARMPRKVPQTAEETAKEYFYVIRPESLILKLAL
jgi:hypothetical protein